LIVLSTSILLVDKTEKRRNRPTGILPVATTEREGRREKEEGRRKKGEGGREKGEGRREKEEGGRRKEEG
jgi:hypothetical protein